MLIMPLNFRVRSRAVDLRVLIFRILFLNLAASLGRMRGNDFCGLQLKRKIPLKKDGLQEKNVQRFFLIFELGFCRGFFLNRSWSDCGFSLMMEPFTK
jgi:hypothetical protein